MAEHEGLDDEEACEKLREEGHTVRNGTVEGVVVVTTVSGEISRGMTPDGWKIWTILENGEVHIVWD